MKTLSYIAAGLSLLFSLAYAETQTQTTTLSFSVTAVKNSAPQLSVQPSANAVDKTNHLNNNTLLPGLRLVPVNKIANGEGNTSSAERQHLRVIWPSSE